jgi:hypothetical protein
MSRAEPLCRACQDRPQAGVRRTRLIGFGGDRPPTGAVRLKTPDQFRYIGKDIPIVDLKPMVTGQATFGIDARMPGMVYAAIERPPVMGATLKTCDDAEARQVKGVEQVVMLDLAKPPYGFKPLGGAAVIANNSWTALQGRKKLKIDGIWARTPLTIRPPISRRCSTPRANPAAWPARLGNVDTEFAKGGKTLEASYYTPMLAHAAMEPLAAVAEFKDGKVVTWTCTQNPQAVQDTVAQGAGHQERRRGVPCDAAGRRIRAQVEAGLRRGSRAALEAGGQAGQDRLEPRGRCALRLLPFAGRAVHEGRGGRQRPSHGVAAAQRLPADRHARESERSSTAASSSAWDGPISLIRSPICAWRMARPKRMCASDGCARFRISIMRSACRRLPMNWPRRPDAIAWNTCLN